MKKSAKLSLALALMMGTTAGVQMLAPNNASAEISDKFRLELNGVIANYSDKDNAGGYARQDNYEQGNKYKHNYWNNYSRVQLDYFVDKDTKVTARLHSDFDGVGEYAKNSNSKRAYFDQAYVQQKFRKANITGILGKKGAYLGQGMTFNSSGNLTGAQVSFGNWYDPQCLQIVYGDRDNGDRVLAFNATKDVVKNWQLSVLNLNVNSEYAANKYNKYRIWSFGSKIKTPGVTIVGEYAHNTSDKMRKADSSSAARKGWYVEAYTGPTSDMTSGLPLQKPGTQVWSLKYQDLGKGAQYVHNPTFIDDARGFKLTYGYTIKKGISTDLSIARVKDKGMSDYKDPANGKWKTQVIAELAFKLR